MNILRDPPKSLFTRRIDKVGQNQDITELIDASGDRICEGINVYARGVNPMVSVDYGSANQNGTISGNATRNSSRIQPALPYKINRDGAFRPPIQTARDLLPLSRQPRNVTYIDPSPGFADYSMKIAAPLAKDLRQIKQETINVSVRPTAVFQIEKPFTEPYETKYKIVENPIKYSLQSGTRTLDWAETNMDIHDERVIKNSLHAYNVSSNISSNRINAKTLDELNDIQIRTKQPRYSDVITHKKGYEKDNFVPDKDVELGRNMPNYDFSVGKKGYERDNFVPDKDVELNRNVPLYDTVSQKKGYERDNFVPDKDVELGRNMPLYDFSVGKKGYEKDHFVPDKEVELGRNVPHYDARTNNYSTSTFVDISSKDYRLPPSLSLGGFTNNGTMTSFDRPDTNIELNSERNRLAKKAFAHFEDRFMRN
jgi:hypothetical protein